MTVDDAKALKTPIVYVKVNDIGACPEVAVVAEKTCDTDPFSLR